MFSMKTALVAGIASVGLFFAAPSESQAQNFGVRLNFGQSGFSYYQNDYPVPVYTPRVYAPPSYVVPYRHDHHHHNHGLGASTVVVPERYHWTPYRGWHTHGTVVTPSYTGRPILLPY